MTFLDKMKDENNGIMECWNIGMMGSQNNGLMLKIG
jgi:hypothetical protein